jgi:hypothetical protein
LEGGQGGAKRKIKIKSKMKIMIKIKMKDKTEKMEQKRRLILFKSLGKHHKVQAASLSQCETDNIDKSRNKFTLLIFLYSREFEAHP